MLLHRAIYPLCICVILAVVGCNEQDKLQIEQSASAFDLKQGEASVLQSNQHFMKAYKSKDTMEIVQSYTTDAKVMVSGQPPVSGRKNIGRYYSGKIKSGAAEFKLNTIKVWGDSVILVEEGTYVSLDSNGKQNDKGEYITLWQQEAGNWKIFRDMWVSSAPLSAIKIEKTALPSK